MEPASSTTPRSPSIRTNSSAYSGLPPALCDERRLCLGGQDRPHEQLGQQLLHLVLRQRRERDGRRVRFAASPPAANVEELGPRRPHQQDRRDLGLVVQLIQEIEHGLVRPVEILDGEDER